MRMSFFLELVIYLRPPPNPRILNFKRLIKNINHTSEIEDYLSEI